MTLPSLPSYGLTVGGIGESTMFGYSSSQSASASNYIAALAKLASELNPATIDPQFPTTPSAPVPVTDTAPVLEPVV